MADFNQAIKWMKEGKKVKRKIWGNKYFICLSDDFFKQFLFEKRIASFSLIDLESVDWEICEEEFSLSEQIEYYTKTTKVLQNHDVILVEDVKEFIRRRDELDWELRQGFITDKQHMEKNTNSQEKI